MFHPSPSPSVIRVDFHPDGRCLPICHQDLTQEVFAGSGTSSLQTSTWLWENQALVSTLALHREEACACRSLDGNGVLVVCICLEKDFNWASIMRVIIKYLISEKKSWDSVRGTQNKEPGWVMVGMFIDNKQQDASPHWCINTPSTDKTESKRNPKGFHSVVNTQH